MLERIEYNGAARRAQGLADLLPMCEPRTGHLTNECQRDVIISGLHQSARSLQGQSGRDSSELRRDISIRPDREK
jgi:hypothetical protein